MNKVIMNVITICLISAGFMTAHANTEKEILFRGIPWETDIDGYTAAVSESIEAQGAVFTTEQSVDVQFIEGFTGIGEIKVDCYFPAITCFETVFWIDRSSFTVAGIETDCIRLYGIPEANEETQVHGKEDSNVVFASYMMELSGYADKDAVCEALFQKLSDLYGKPDEEEYHVYIWYGLNDTFCEMYRYNTGQVRICYGKTDLPDRMIPLLNDADSIDTSNVDGL